FAIVSSDCDFTPLVMRILTNGLKAYGFGERKTPSPFVRACSTFLYLESIEQPDDLADGLEGPKAETADRKTGKELKQDAKLMNLLRSAIKSTQECDQGAKLSSIGAHIKNQASFDPRNYGYVKLIGLFEAIDLFEVSRKQKCIYVKAVKR
ncbi:MAG: NYN domain-containing protein, partial [Phormidesmis sp.]